MRIIEEIIQRLAALILTLVWVAVPLGFGVMAHRTQPEFIVDDSRADLAEERAVVWLMEAADEPVAASPEPEGDDGPATDGVADAEPNERGEGAPAQPARAVASTPRAAAPTTSGSTRMTRPGVEVAADQTTGRKERRRRTRECEEPSEYISKVNDDTYRVNREIVEYFANDWEALGRLGRVRVHENERGKRDGFTVGGIRCGTVLAQVGLKNRDTVHSVNGKPVKNLFGALAAYRKFKRDAVVELEITRDGETEYLTYYMH